MVKVCVVGCLHGELDRMYEDILATEQEQGFTTDIVLCCGDFQSLRSPPDLESMSVKPKYYTIGDFYKYYAEEAVAPRLTVFVGGNHEASAYLQELPYGGWAAPNIYYMGYAGVVQFAGLRIGAISGIHKPHDYTMGHFEHPPYSENTKRSAYHTRNLDVFRLSQIRRRLDIVLSHDWPRGIYHYGETGTLCRVKPYLRSDIERNCLGSPPSERLFCYLQPRYWFSAHLHCKFAALVQHGADSSAVTRFLALHKCLPNRDYMQFLDIEPDPRVKWMRPWDEWQHDAHPSDPVMIDESSLPPEDDDDGEEEASAAAKCDHQNTSTSDSQHQQSQDKKAAQVSHKLCLDPEWMAVLRSTDPLMSVSKIPCILPDGSNGEKFDYSANDDEIAGLWEAFGGQFRVPENFEPTLAPFKPYDHVHYLTPDSTRKEVHSALNSAELIRLAEQPSIRGSQLFHTNPQTELMCAMLELTHPNASFLGKSSYDLQEMNSRMHGASDEEAVLDYDEEGCSSDEEASAAKGAGGSVYRPSLVANVSGMSYEPDISYQPESTGAGPSANTTDEVSVDYEPGSVEPVRCVNPELIDLPDDDDEDDDESANEPHPAAALTSTPKNERR